MTIAVTGVMDSHEIHEKQVLEIESLWLRRAGSRKKVHPCPIVVCFFSGPIFFRSIHIMAISFQYSCVDTNTKSPRIVDRLGQNQK